MIASMREITMAQSIPEVPVSLPMLERARTIYQSGMSCRQLAAALGCNSHTSRELIMELRACSDETETDQRSQHPDDTSTPAGA